MGVKSLGSITCASIANERKMVQACKFMNPCELDVSAAAEIFQAGDFYFDFGIVIHQHL